jgi:hypothetical protein
MGGPYLGELSFHGRKMNGRFLMDHIIASQNNKYLLFSKWLPDFKKKVHLLGFFPYNRWCRCFKIFIYDTSSNTFYEQIGFQKCLYISSMIESNIIYHEAFHDQLEVYRREIEFNIHNFILVPENELYER